MEHAVTVDWAEHIRQDVIARAARFVASRAASPDQEMLLDIALVELRARAAAPGELLPSVHLPLLVAASIDGREPQDARLALPTAFVELGIDLLDHVLDWELGPHWEDTNPGLVLLAANGLLCSFPHLAIADLDAPAERKAALHACMAQHFVQIGEGQQQDLQIAAGAPPNLVRVESSIAGKTGERRGLYARFGALYAGADGEACERWAGFGRALGIARQVASDLEDLLRGAGSRDLAAGARTWPVAWALSRLEGGERGRFLDLLARARKEPEQRAEVLEWLRRRGAVMRTILQVAELKQRAEKALQEAHPAAPLAERLRQFVTQIGEQPQAAEAASR